MIKMAKKTSPKIRVEILARAGDSILFLWPSWVAPLYALRATVSSVNIQGSGKKKEATYNVEWKSQQARMIKGDGTLARLPSMVKAGSGLIVNDCISKVKKQHVK